MQQPDFLAHLGYPLTHYNYNEYYPAWSVNSTGGGFVTHPSINLNLKLFVSFSTYLKTYGLFTEVFIPKGSFIGFYSDVFIDDALGERLRNCPTYAEYGVQVEYRKKFNMTFLSIRSALHNKYDMTNLASIMAFANEAPELPREVPTSAHNNMFMSIIQLDGNRTAAALFAARNIFMFEELFWYYGDKYNRNWPVPKGTSRHGNSKLPVQKSDLVATVTPHMYYDANPYSCVIEHDIIRTSAELNRVLLAKYRTNLLAFCNIDDWCFTEDVIWYLPNRVRVKGTVRMRKDDPLDAIFTPYGTDPGSEHITLDKYSRPFNILLETFEVDLHTDFDSPRL